MNMRIPRRVGAPATGEMVNNAADRVRNYQRNGTPTCDDTTCGVPRRNCYLPYSKGVVVNVPAGKFTGTAVWKAQRDVAIDQMIVEADAEVAAGAQIAISYCNDLLVDGVPYAAYETATEDRPGVVMLYRSPKEIEITVTLLVVAGSDGVNLAVSFFGDQSKGCCDGAAD